MNPYQISADPDWHRWVDGLVILAVGVFAGLVLAQALMTEEVTTTTEIIRQVQKAPKAEGPQIESGVSTDVPSGARVDEV